MGLKSENKKERRKSASSRWGQTKMGGIEAREQKKRVRWGLALEAHKERGVVDARENDKRT